jgi:CHAT domain-containing protein
MRFFFVFLFVSLCFALACRQDTQPDAEATVQTNGVADAAILISLADSLFKLGEHYDSLNKKDSALYFHEQALSTRQKVYKEDIRLVESYIKVAEYYRREFKYDVADKFYDHARLIADQVKIQPDALIDLYIDAAVCKVQLKDVSTSMSLLQKALSITDKYIIEKELMYYRINFTMASNYYYLKDHNRFIEYLNKSLKYLHKDDHLRLIAVYNSLGIGYRDSGNSEKAIEYFNVAITHSLRLSRPSPNELAKIYLQKAFAHQDVGEIDSTEYYLKLNLAIRKEVFGEKHVNTFGAKYSVGNFYEAINSYDSALKYYHESLVSLVKNFDDQNVKTNPAPAPIELNTDVVIGLVSKASALKMLSVTDPANNDNMDLALDTYLLADSVFSVFRKSLSHDDPQLRQMEIGYIPFHDMVGLAFALYQKTGSREYLQKSLNIIENSRAQLLETALNRAEAYSSSAISQPYREEEGRLIKQQMEILRLLSLPGLQQSMYDSVSDALLSVSDQLLRLHHSIEKTSPGYFLLKYNQQTTSLEQIQTLLDKRNGVLIEYLWGEEKIYVLALSKDTVKLKIVDQTESFRSAFADFIQELTGDPGETYKQERFNRFFKSAFTLYRELVADLLPVHHEASYSSLIISADGPLATFPFEALITSIPQSNEVDYRLPYLMKRFPISYTHSTGIFVRQSKRERNGNKLLALGFSGNGPSRVQRNGFTSLPGTEKEIQSIREVMKNSRNKYYLEADASEAKFKSLVTDFNIVHLAMHGVADSANALESKLIFRTDADSLEDGNLYAHELYSLDLKKLDLAVLSACESGIGKQQTGEGLMSIARGFTYAGCPTQIISLWKIDDRTSARVMANFYRHLSAGEDINIALTNAKADYIESAKELNSHPAYWAAFLQVGDSRPIEKQVLGSKFLVICFLCLLILGLGAIGIIWFKRYLAN